jgi:hypothetical protein
MYGAPITFDSIKAISLIKSNTLDDKYICISNNINITP